MDTSKRKPLFREHLRDFAEELLQEPFDSMIDVVRSKLMARFFAEGVLRPRNPGLLPFGEEDLEACVVDGKDDQGVDFIAREEGSVIVIQAKFSGGKKLSKRAREDPSHFDSFRNVLNRLRGYRNLEMNESLREVAAEIDWENDHFQLYYITLRQLAANQSKIAASGVTPIPEVVDLLDRTELHLLNESKLNEELRDTLSIDEQQNRTVKLLFSANDESPPWARFGESSRDRGCYVGRISGAQLAVLFTEHKSSLFSLNIRNYVGDNATNRTIRRTALDDPNEFFFFNNGISALAARIEPDTADETGRTLLCQQLSIVNGAQTVRSLHKAHIADPQALHDVQVLLRVTEFSTKKIGEEQEFLDNVTKYNNTQNSIKLSDFRSNDKVQFDIRKRFSRLPAVDGKKFLYKNKRSGERAPGRIVIGMEEFVKTVYAFQFGPDDVFGGTGHVFDSTKAGGYAKLFGDAGGILPSLTNETFAYYAGIWFICSYAKGLWQSQARTTKEGALERRWMFYYALGAAMRISYDHQGLDFQVAVRLLTDPCWTKGPDDTAVKKAISRFSKVAFKALIDSYRTAETVSTFTHRNWFRSQLTLDQISKQIASSWELLSEHAEDYTLPKPK